MSRGTSDRQRIQWGVGPVLTVAIIGALAVMAFAYGFRGPTAAAAQASPAASPTATCTPATAAAPPAAASPAASPVALSGTPAATDQATAATTAVANYVACWNAQNIDALVSLSTPNYLATYWGADSADAAKTALAPLTSLKPMFTVSATQDVQTYDDGRVSVEVMSTLGEYQFLDERWYFTPAGDQWLLDQVDTLPTGPEGDTSIVGVVIDPTAAPPLAPNSTTSAPFPVLDFHIQSTDTAAHAVWVLMLPAASQGTPIAGGTVPEGTEFIGLATVPGTPEAANPSNGDIWLTNLGPGTYTLTDLTTSATFTVTPPPPATPGAGTPAA